MTEEQIKQILYSKLVGKRLNHSLMVAKASKSLAKLYNVDVDRAYKAGLLHDIMKNESRENQLLEIKTAGIQINDDELENDKLLHAPAGAAFIINNTDETDIEVINAIRYHTTGRPKMSVLEKVVYVADLISEDREYTDVDIVREKASRSLNEAIFYITSFQISYLVKNNLLIGSNTIGLYNEMIKEFYRVDDNDK
ncbi:MAG: bis(5'-nucleosyl)-tetraphosphatase (symmetrical) YqeK [Clostridia bacterium]|nr:bis(5'-nucleosyl)-tetraphosphatase (symmetrical) YqeK [Clostridia bacterium]